MEDDLRWKTTLIARQWNSTFDRKQRQTFMKYASRWKTAFDVRQTLMEDNLNERKS